MDNKRLIVGIPTHKCPVCGSNEFRKFSTGNQQCIRCQSMFFLRVEDKDKQENLNKHYERWNDLREQINFYNYADTGGFYEAIDGIDICKLEVDWINISNDIKKLEKELGTVRKDRW